MITRREFFVDAVATGLVAGCMGLSANEIKPFLRGKEDSGMLKGFSPVIPPELPKVLANLSAKLSAWTAAKPLIVAYPELVEWSDANLTCKSAGERRRLWRS